MVAIDEPHKAATRYLQMNFEHGNKEGGEGLRSGDGTAHILEAWTEDENGVRRSTFMSDERLVFKARVRFDEPVVEPNFNVVFVNDQNQNVFAVSTVAEGGTGRYETGDVASLTVEFVASFAPGRVFLSMNASHPGAGTDFMDRWERMFSLLIASPSAGGGIVDLPYELQIDRETTTRLERETA